MKKFILCACFVFLYGAAAQALSFRNERDEKAEFFVQINNAAVPVEAGKTVGRVDVRDSTITVQVAPEGMRPHLCEFDEPVTLRSPKTIVLKKSGMGKACVLE